MSLVRVSGLAIAVVTGVLVLTLFPSNILGADSGPHGGSVLESKTHTFEVKIEPKDNKIHIHTLRSTTTTLPPEIELRFIQNGSNKGSIHVKALDLSNQLPEYHGNFPTNLRPNIGSYAGIELRFRLNGKKYRLQSN